VHLPPTSIELKSPAPVREASKRMIDRSLLLAAGFGH
jgi:hypothetical protein